MSYEDSVDDRSGGLGCITPDIVDIDGELCTPHRRLPYAPLPQDARGGGGRGYHDDGRGGGGGGSGGVGMRRSMADLSGDIMEYDVGATGGSGVADSGRVRNVEDPSNNNHNHHLHHHQQQQQQQHLHSHREPQSQSHSSAQPQASSTPQAEGSCTLGLYGWRRRCLYALLLFLTATVTLNLALTLFFMRVLDFSPSGLGALQIVRGGLVATAPVHVTDSLVATHITSRPHVPLTLLAAHNISIVTVDDHGHVRSSLVLSADGLSVSSGRLSVKDTQGRVVFSASEEEVVVGARRLVVAGEGGAAFSGSVQTGHLSSPVGKPLLLESTTRSLEISAPQGVTVESRAGSIEAHCLGDLTLQSTGGMITLASSRVVVRGLPTSTVQSNQASTGPDVYQVCVCSGGRLFLAAPGGVCAADHTFCK